MLSSHHCPPWTSTPTTTCLNLVRASSVCQLHLSVPFITYHLLSCSHLLFPDLSQPLDTELPEAQSPPVPVTAVSGTHWGNAYMSE